MKLSYTEPAVSLPSGMTNGTQPLTIELRHAGHGYNLVASEVIRSRRREGM